MKKFNVAIVGASGAVGHEFLKVLAERDFPIGELRLLATERSAGTKIKFKDQEYEVQATTNDSFAGIDIALFAGGSASTVYAKPAVEAGAVVIDNSSNFRYDPEVPLVVPEVNPQDVRWHKGIIANPNCSTIIMVVALKPLHDLGKIKRVVVSTYQACSGAGLPGMEELQKEVEMIVAGQADSIAPKAFAHQIAFNLIPQIDVLTDNGYYKEEMKMTWETQKIFHDDNIKLAATCVRVPVFRSHSEAVTVELEKHITVEEAAAALRKAPGVVVIDDPANNKYPMPLYTSDTDEVYVGRIREDISSETGINMWVVADQIRKGAATNAIQIAELLIRDGLV